MMYGRDEEEWQVLEDATREFLIERAKLKFLTSYTELETVLRRRTGLRGFDYKNPDERAAMGYLLGRVADASIAETGTETSPGLMLSALVTYLNENNAGSGFFALAQERRLLEAGASKLDKEAFWVVHVQALQDHFGKAP